MTLSEQIARWASEAGRPLTSFERMKLSRPFRYNQVTNHWYRVLKPCISGFPYGYVELDLGFDAANSIYPFWLVIHNQPADEVDRFVARIPDSDAQVMSGLHGPELVQWLLYGDVWGRIDQNRLHYLRGRRLGIEHVRLKDVLNPDELTEALNY